MVISIHTLDQNDRAVRRTTSDDIFDEIYSQICKMKILPGAKLSEVEIAKKFDVSRQPVREAFIRLGNLGLLTIRPQRATKVSKISLAEVANARFIRLSIELEIFDRALENFKAEHENIIKLNLDKQRSALKSDNFIEFKKLDTEFHKIFYKIAGMPQVFNSITEQKVKVDRLCLLSLTNKIECEEVFEDHEKILTHIVSKDREALIKRVRSHLSRLDTTLEKISLSHAHYFDL